MATLALATSAQSVTAAASRPTSAVTVRLLHDIDAVADAWDALASRVPPQSPAQSRTVIATWVSALGIRADDQYYVLAERNGHPVALLPLVRRRVRGVRLLSFFAGPHVGCDAPLIDPAVLAELGSVGRAALWSAMLAPLADSDVVYLKSIPATLHDGIDLFAELGQSIAAETLHRAEFTSFAEADRTQRNKSRRKHDRQQGDRLDALGEVGFEVLGNGPAAQAVLYTMFAQRAARFRDMGIDNPFECPGIGLFYASLAAARSGTEVVLHVLRLDGAIVAVRYNVVVGDRMFCLISSMSADPAIQAGSPGKQCLLRVMQSVFDTGIRVFDMGTGLTDEKRHWCNVQVPVRHHYVPLTPVGDLAAGAHFLWQHLRRRLKANARLVSALRGLRARIGRAVPETP